MYGFYTKAYKRFTPTVFIGSDALKFTKEAKYLGFTFNPIRSGGALKAPPPLRFFALTHLILELHYCALVTFPKK